jgi:hypothetical protein
MGRNLCLATVCMLMLANVGCVSIVNAGPDQEPVPLGFVFTSVRWTDKASPNAVSTTTDKVGTSESVGILGIAAFGDATVEKAMKEGNITDVHAISHEFQTILLLFNTYRTIVKGK